MIIDFMLKLLGFSSRSSVRSDEDVLAHAPFEVRLSPATEVDIFWGKLQRECDERHVTGGAVLPVGLGLIDELKPLLCDAAACADSFEALCARGETIDARQWLEKTLTEVKGSHSDRKNSEVADDTHQPPFRTPVIRFSQAYDWRGKPYARPYVFALLPLEHVWMIPAYLRSSGKKNCPAADYQYAVLKYWAELYGAMPTVVSSDVMEFDVARPPQTFAAALQLAREHFAFCPDNVEYGAGSVGNLAAVLLERRHWYFFWG